MTFVDFVADAIHADDWTEVSVDQLRAGLAEHAVQAHGQLDIFFDVMLHEQIAETRRVAEDHNLGPRTLDFIVNWISKRAFDLRMEAHRDLEALIQESRQTQEVGIAVAERDVSGLPLQ